MTTLEGYAAVFNSPAFIREGGIEFTESIAPGAFDFVLADQRPGQGTVLVRDHDRGRILGRNHANLLLVTDAKGLKFRAELPDTPLAKETEVLIEKKILNGNSFAFLVGRESWYESKIKDSPPHRIIEALSLLADVSICVDPAYAATSVTVGRGRLPSAETLGKIQELQGRLEKLRAPGSTRPKVAMRSALPVGRRISNPLTPRTGLVRRGCGHVGTEFQLRSEGSERSGRGGRYLKAGLPSLSATAWFAHAGPRPAHR